MKKNINSIKNNKDKQNTYAQMITKCNLAFKQGFYFECLVIEYAMIEDRLRSIIYHNGGLHTRTARRFNKKDGVNQKIQEVIKPYLEYKEDQSLGVSSISNKMKIVRCLTRWSSETDSTPEDSYLKILKHQYESLDAQHLLETLDQLKDWNGYRNEIIHALLNKNMFSLNEQLTEKVEEGMAIARSLDDSCRVVKKGNKIRRFLKLQNN